jgi:parvulin-like peptidyl-prolyl isomerase
LKTVLLSLQVCALSVNTALSQKLLNRVSTVDDLIPVLGEYGILPQLMRELIVDEAIADITLSSDEVMAACQQFYERHQLKTEADVQTWLAQRGVLRDQLEPIITRELRLAQHKKTVWEPKVNSYFLERKPKLDRVVYSLIRVKDLGIAQELYFRIQEGEQSFREIAQEHSQGVEAETGGVLGPVELGTPHPAIAKLLITNQPGHLIPPTRLGEWFIILRLEKLIPAQLDEALQQRLLNELFETWLQGQIAQLQAPEPPESPILAKAS